MAEIITKRILPIRWDKGVNDTPGSLNVTITPELRDIGIDPEKHDIKQVLTVKLVRCRDGKKRIVIERIEKTRETSNGPVRPKGDD